MRSYTFILAVISLSSAQSTTKLFLPGFDSQQLFASVVGSDSTATTYAIACADTKTCGLDGPFTLTEGPVTAHYTMNVGDVLATVDCSIAGTTSAFCTGTYSGGASSDSLSTTIVGTELAGYFLAFTVTDKLPESTDAKTTIAPSTTAGAKTTPAPSTTATPVSSTSTGSAASVSQSLGAATTSTGAVKTSTAGVPQMTGNAGWAVGGMAVALAVAGL